MLVRLLLPLMLFTYPLGAAQETRAEPVQLDCRAGPLSRNFGSTPWLVYACSDQKSVVVVSAPGSPAAPFYFMLFLRDGQYAVVGEGTGLKSHTDRAYADLTRLTARDISNLIREAKAQGSANSKQ